MTHDHGDDRPLELPIKRAPRAPAKSTIEPKSTPAPRDPRFDPRCSGSDDRRHFVRNYAFLNEAKQAEMKELQTAFKRERDPDKKEKIKATIARFRNKMIDPDREFNARKPRGKLKKVELAETFKQLKETGKLNKYLERKRKKLLKRDQRTFE